MQKIYLWVSLLLISTTLFGNIKGAYSSRFAIELDHVFMRRTSSHNKHVKAAIPINPQEIPISTILPHEIPASATTVECCKEEGKAMLKSGDLIRDMWFDSGFSVALKIFPSIDSTWEGRYLGGLSWQGQKSHHCLRTFNTDGSLVQPNIGSDFTSSVKGIYNSKMYTCELNYWNHVTPRYTDHFSVSWIAGLRYLDINEKLTMSFTCPINFVPQTSRYRVCTENILFGPQLGGNLEYNPSSWLTWGLVVKIGGLFNRDKQHTLILNEGTLIPDEENTAVVRNCGKKRSNFSYTTQVFPFIEIRPAKHFFFLINYQVLYLGGIATADRNLVFHDGYNTGNILDYTGHIIYHGATCSIQFNF